MQSPELSDEPPVPCDLTLGDAALEVDRHFQGGLHQIVGAGIFSSRPEIAPASLDSW